VNAECNILPDFLGGEEVAAFKMKSTSGWANGGNGDNSSGFNGLPGGHCFSNGDFISITEKGFFWSSSEVDVTSAWDRGLLSNTSKVYRYTGNKQHGVSVRCVRD